MCGKCGEYEAFRNSLEETAWSGAAQKTKVEVEDRSKLFESKEEFLKNTIPTRKTSDGMYTEEFKLKMIELALQINRASVRKKFDIPETTLRGWIKQYMKRKDRA